MISVKMGKGEEKQKRFSESKPSPAFEYKFPQHIPTSQHHNRSSSIDKNKKLRLLTDYEDSEPKYSQEKNLRKIYNPKKSKGHEYYSSKCPANEIHSTKSNAKKNNELRLLFNRTKQNQEQKAKNKGFTSHHPLLKYVSQKNKDRFQSPYEK